MKDEFITLETAKLAKEKGFNIPVCNYINPNGVWDCKKETTYYWDDGHCDGVNDIGGTIEQDYNNSEVNNWNYETYGIYYNADGIKENYSAPTQSLLQRWVRETHQIDILVYKVNKQYTTILCSKHYNTYEQALEKGLLKTLKIIFKTTITIINK